MFILKDKHAFNHIRKKPRRGTLKFPTSLEHSFLAHRISFLGVHKYVL